MINFCSISVGFTRISQAKSLALCDFLPLLETSFLLYYLIKAKNVFFVTFICTAWDNFWEQITIFYLQVFSSLKLEFFEFLRLSFLVWITPARRIRVVFFWICWGKDLEVGSVRTPEIPVECWRINLGLMFLEGKITWIWCRVGKRMPRISDIVHFFVQTMEQLVRQIRIRAT